MQYVISKTNSNYVYDCFKSIFNMFLIFVYVYGYARNSVIENCTFISFEAEKGGWYNYSRMYIDGILERGPTDAFLWTAGHRTDNSGFL